jgi:hypothetical protein
VVVAAVPARSWRRVNRLTASSCSRSGLRGYASIERFRRGGAGNGGTPRTLRRNAAGVHELAPRRDLVVGRLVVVGRFRDITRPRADGSTVAPEPAGEGRQEGHGEPVGVARQSWDRWPPLGAGRRIPTTAGEGIPLPGGYPGPPHDQRHRRASALQHHIQLFARPPPLAVANAGFGPTSAWPSSQASGRSCSGHRGAPAAPGSGGRPRPAHGPWSTTHPGPLRVA